ncbi:MAG: hypothetical protein HGA35_07030 [Erysipelotrichaceae bacterium]|jgi:hypothetical protein|nr:hypothetical protein [Erysipelotrichaceae bacterium]
MSDLTVAEQEDVIKTTKIADNAVVLSNVVELATSVIIKIAGKDIADSVGKQSLNRNMLSNLVANRIKEKVLK